MVIAKTKPRMVFDVVPERIWAPLRTPHVQVLADMSIEQRSEHKRRQTQRESPSKGKMPTPRSGQIITGGYGRPARKGHPPNIVIGAQGKPKYACCFDSHASNSYKASGARIVNLQPCIIFAGAKIAPI